MYKQVVQALITTNSFIRIEYEERQPDLKLLPSWHDKDWTKRQASTHRKKKGKRK